MIQVSLSSKSGNGMTTTATAARPAMRSGALPRSRCNDVMHKNFNGSGNLLSTTHWRVSRSAISDDLNYSPGLKEALGQQGVFWEEQGGKRRTEGCATWMAWLVLSCKSCVLCIMTWMTWLVLSHRSCVCISWPGWHGWFFFIRIVFVFHDLDGMVGSLL